MRYREIIREGIVFRDRFADSDGQRTVIAVNPTKAEWDKWFPQGAGGVLFGRHSAFVELWLFNDDWQNPSEDEVRAFCVKRYGETLEQIEAQLKSAVTRFMGDVPVKAIPLGEDQDPLLPGDDAFIRAAFPR